MPQPPKEKAKMGRPPYQPTDFFRSRVRRMAQIGLRHSDIAFFVGVCQPTLRTYYLKELMEGAAEGREQVVETLYSMATDGKHQAATIFFAKTRCNIMQPQDDTPPTAEENAPNPADGSLLAEFEAVVKATGPYIFPHERAAAEAQSQPLAPDTTPEPFESDPESEPESDSESDPPETPSNLCDNPFCRIHHPQPESEPESDPPPSDAELDADFEPSPPGHS